MPKADGTPTKAEIRAEMDASVLDYIDEVRRGIKAKTGQKVARSFAATMAKDEIFLRRFEDVVTRVFENNPIPEQKCLVKKDNGKVERQLNLILSDLHIGNNLDAREFPYQYKHQEYARRLAKIALETAEYKLQHRDTTILNVNILGDIIQGALGHDKRDGDPIAEQGGAAMHLLTQFIVYLAAHFKKVVVRCTPGNHGRILSRHEDRAFNGKWDAYETLVYTGLKLGTAHLKNVTVEIPYTPYFTYDVFGDSMMFTHGDTIVNVGNPGGVLNVGKIDQQITKLNATRPTGKQFKVVGVGHVHVASRVKLASKVVLFSNGALTPPDGFSVGIGNLDGSCSQTLFESVPGYTAGDYRELEVDLSTDRDSRLDKIIKPFKAF
jgi:hypothetical protein